MDLNAYHRALDLGFSEHEAAKIGEDAWENAAASERHYEPEYPDAPMCDICGKSRSVTGSNGYAVCSKECSDVATDSPTRTAPGAEGGDK